MSAETQFCIALSVAVGRLSESEEPGDPQKRAMRALLALTEQHSATIRLYHGVLSVDGSPMGDDVPGAAFLRDRFSLHGVSELIIARGAEADELLAMVRGLAADGGQGRIKEKLRDAGSSKIMVIVEQGPDAARGRQRSISDAFAKVEVDDAALAEWNRFLSHGAHAKEKAVDVGLQVPPEETRYELASPPRPQAAGVPPAEPPAPQPPPPAPALPQPATLQLASPLGIALANVVRDPYGLELLPRLTQLSRQVQDAMARDNVAEAIDALSAVVELEAKAPEVAKSSYAATFNRMFNGAVAAQIAPYLLDPRRASRAAAVLGRAGGAAAEILTGLVATAQTLQERVAYFAVIRRLPRAVDRVLALMSRPEWQVVRNAAELVGEIRIEESVALLAGLLDHHDARVVRAAAIALARIATPATLEPLRRVFRDGTPELKSAVASAVGGEQARALTAPLLALAESEANPDLAREYLKAIGRIGTPAAVQALQKAAEPGGRLLSRKPAHLRLGAVEGLRLANATSALEALSQDGDKNVREAARQALGR